MRKFVALMLAFSQLLISAVPMASTVVCAMPGMNSSDINIADQAMQIKPTPSLLALQDCYIECGCRIDNHLAGMPHQLAPHTLSLISFDIEFTVNRVSVPSVATFTSHPWFVPTPPPRPI